MSSLFITTWLRVLRGAHCPRTLCVISGGQTGVDRAALDAALTRGLNIGGWCPKLRWAEDGAVPARYPLRETPAARPEQRTAWNVRDSDGTLLLTRGVPDGGTAWTIRCAESLRRPHLVVDLRAPLEPRAVAAWIVRERITRLNIAGPRESTAPGVTVEARRYLERVLEFCG
jgi:hypothetical protein